MSTVVSRQTKPAKKKRDAEGHAAHTQTASTSGMPGKMKRPIKLTMLGAGSGFKKGLQAYYRVTSRVDGPRGTVSYVQVIMF